MADLSRPPSAFSIWLWAARPRTLPLAASAITLGYGLALMNGTARAPVFLLALITALLLQILSNLANDYGDAVAGTDTRERLGPLRMTASGLATPERMLRAIVLAAFLALASGLVLVLLAAWGNWPLLVFFLFLGAACVAAAILYTMGKRPYGYIGLGDFMAGFFFGPVAVWGSAALCGSGVVATALLPGLAAGFCSTMVLNVNNMRDIETDRKNGKMTVAARLGLGRATRYHAALFGLTCVCWIIFWLMQNPMFLPGLSLAIPLGRSVFLAASRPKDAACLNSQLRNTVLGSAFLGTGMAVLCALA
ncbi:1,4-dihydroxy-2-naphthoate octaprenyltransferase [Desulfovibrio sp. OttesenSCG-928-O18]|nr:1,4-dihydroxy-2-naphthoate octaprenyltransferase [Desulfovibrio sp. OttesenSCG-928-O18]